MKIIKGNIWDFHSQGKWVIITTNGIIDRNNKAVMGVGVALEAATKFPNIPSKLAEKIKQKGNLPFLFLDEQIITLPVKNDWKEKADLHLLETSIAILSEAQKILEIRGYTDNIYMVWPGCGAGGRTKKEVRPILEKYLSDKFIVCELKK
ncbi:MAG: hypothetical protein WC755_08540 [Candidatus Woesearchaeota archaeon]|jgi:hypothetical protein